MTRHVPLEELWEAERRARISVVRSPGDPACWGKLAQAVASFTRAQVVRLAEGREVPSDLLKIWVAMTCNHQIARLAGDNRFN